MMLKRAEASFLFMLLLCYKVVHTNCWPSVSHAMPKLPRQFLENLFSFTLTANGHGCTCHEVVLLLLE